MENIEKLLCEMQVDFICAPKNKRTIARALNLVSRAHVPFGQHQDTELWKINFQRPSF